MTQQFPQQFDQSGGYGGHQAPPAKKPRRWPWIAGIAVAFLLGTAIGSSGGSGAGNTASTAAGTTTVQAPATTVTVSAGAPAEAPAAAAPAPAAEGPKSSFGPGTYEVGSDIQPGKYKTAGPEGAAGICYWARLKSTNGDFDAIIANGTPQGPSVITIAKSDAAFETNGCTWTKAG